MADDLLHEHGGKIAAGGLALVIAFGRWLVGREFRRIDKAVESSVSRDELTSTVAALRTENQSAHQGLRNEVIEMRGDVKHMHERIDDIYKLMVGGGK